MELKGSKTEKNLQTAFAGESQARNKYTYFASKARKEGYVQIANIFEETANNEKEHAKLWFKLLQENGEIGTTAENLKAAAEGENGRRGRLQEDRSPLQGCRQDRGRARAEVPRPSQQRRERPRLLPRRRDGLEVLQLWSHLCRQEGS